MATMNLVIEHVDRVNPNVFTDTDKYEWMSTLDGLVAHEVLQEEAPNYSIPDDADTPLLVQSPYDDIYRLYVTAMVYLHNREYDHYNNAVLVFKEDLMPLLERLLYSKEELQFLRENGL